MPFSYKLSDKSKCVFGPVLSGMVLNLCSKKYLVSPNMLSAHKLEGPWKFQAYTQLVSHKVIGFSIS
jgi:hypothetical protein